MKKLVLNGILISMAMILSYVERLFPLELIVPLPGIKLGLANVVTIFALFYLDIKSAVIISLLRCVLVSMLFGNISSFLFSFSGAIAALFIMALLKRGYGKYFSIIGISIGGAAAHNIGQILIAAVLLKSTGIFSYLTVLLAASIVTGILTATVSASILNHMETMHMKKTYN